MTSKFILLVAAFCLCWLVIECNSSCNLPTSLWCSSSHIARNCQVEDQCETNVWSQLRSDKPVPRVDFTLYYESLCVGCKLMITNQVWPAYNAVGTIFNLDLVPYGNAQEQQVGDKWNFTCDHGPDECLGNTIQACTIILERNISTVFPFIACMEKSDELSNVSGPVCAKQHGIDYAQVMKCVDGKLGNEIEHLMAVRTDKLDPPHTFVPWITINGHHTDAMQEKAETDLVKLICDTYQGPKPEGCLTKMSHKCNRIAP